MTERQSYLPSVSIDTLRQRAHVLKQIRTFFDDRGFFEVQTPVLSRDTVVDRFIEPIPVDILSENESQKLWLQTSPEFLMKRLVAAGADAIYQIGPAFRAGEIGDLHELEFTMLEWYRVGDDYRQGMDLLDEFAQSILGLSPARRMSYRQLFIETADIDPFDNHCQSDRSEFLNMTLVNTVEPKLKSMGSMIIFDWPAEQAALARTREDEGVHVAERFELYVDGVELANGYHELTDAEILLNRNEETNQLREQDGRDPLPVHSRLIEAMDAGLPACSGVALGIDRLAMLLTGNRKISQVMSFGHDRV